MSNKGMSEDMYNFIKDNLHRLTINTDKGIVITPKGTNGTVCSSTGYLRVKVNKRVLQVHQVLAVVYFGDSCIGMQVNHKNGDKFNNTKENLELCTREENLAHAWKTGLFQNSVGNTTVGHLHTSAKLSYDDVIYIRASKESAKVLSDKFSMSTRNIYAVRSRQSYKNID